LSRSVSDQLQRLVKQCFILLMLFFVTDRPYCPSPSTNLFTYLWLSLKPPQFHIPRDNTSARMLLFRLYVMDYPPPFDCGSLHCPRPKNWGAILLRTLSIATTMTPGSKAQANSIAVSGWVWKTLLAAGR